MEDRVRRTGSWWVPLVTGVLVMGGDCGDSHGPNHSQTGISTDLEAKAAFAFLKSAGGDVARQVPTDFSAPFSVSGASGSASVMGKKTADENNSDPCCYSTTDEADLTVVFSQYHPTASDSWVTGEISWSDFYDSRTHCSDYAGCASTTDHYEALQGASIEVTFESDGKMISDKINVDASSGSDVSSWDVKVINRAGEGFSFTAY